MNRPREHVLEDESKKALINFLPTEWIHRDKDPDYGLDMEIEIVESGEVTNKVLWIQLKATESAKSDHGDIMYQMKTNNLKYYESCRLPVLILYWIKSENNFYYLFAQKYIMEDLSTRNPHWRQQKTVKIIFDSKLETPEDLESFATDGFDYIIQQQQKLEEKVVTILSPISGLCLGRDQELLKLKKNLEHRNILLIKGIAGIGKTTLGLKFRDTLEEKGYQTFWHQFDSQSYESLLLELSEYLKNRGSISAVNLKDQSISPKERLKIAVQELCAYPTILFLDNFQVFEDDSDFKVFSDYLRNSHLVIISRTQPKFLSEEYENLEYLDRNSSVDILKMLNVKEPQEVLQNIYKKTHGHPWSLTCFSRLSRVLPVRNLLEGLPDFSLKQQTYISEQCWQYLSDSEKDFLMRVSVFTKPLDFDALRVCSKAGLSEVLICLAESFYILKRGEDYYIHDIIRDFAFLKLKENQKLYTEAQREAADYYKRILSVENLLLVYHHLKEAGDHNGAVNSIMENIAYFWREGFWLDVREVLEESLGFFKDENTIAEICFYLGTIVDMLGEWDKAIEYLEKSLKIAKEIGDIAGESKCYGNLGVAFRSLGDFRRAIEYLEKSLKIAKEIGNIAGESKCYGNLGVAFRSLGDFRRAIEYLEKSLKIAKEIGNIAGESKCYTDLGATYYGLGDFRRAIEYLEKSLKIAKEIGDIAGESKCYTDLGATYYGLGDFRRAIEYLEKSLKIAKEIGDINLERIVNLNFCQIYYESEKELAYKYCKHAIELSEMISGRLVEEEKKIMFSTQTFDAYHLMIPLCLDLKREKEAFDYTERSKSRAFLDLLAATEIKPTIELTENLESLLHEEQIYLDRWREIQTQNLRQTKISVEPGEIEAIREKLDQIYDHIEEFDVEYVYARKGRPLSSNEVQNMLSSQERNVVLIEYFIAEDKIFIFTLSSMDKKLHVKTIPLLGEKLLQYLQYYWREVVDYPDPKDIGQTWIQLSNYLIDPVSEYLTEDALIYFVPYGPLHYFPLHAMELRGEPLIKRHPVAYAPSASIIKFCQSKGSSKLESCASFGVDSYGNIEKEAEEVARLFRGTCYTNHLATKSNVLKNSTDKDVIHFSCHCYFSRADPLSSAISLYNDILTARGIFDMKLNTELVTLSACVSGASERSPGDELIGLPRAFLYAGAPSVVASLWSVDARSTHELMLEFYKQLKSGQDKATALQKAQIKIMEKEEYAHPYYWAPFVLIGDWE